VPRNSDPLRRGPYFSKNRHVGMFPVQPPPLSIETILRNHIIDIPDFPEEGVTFKDITPLLQSPDSLRQAINLMLKYNRYQDIDIVAVLDSRGFILGTPIALDLNAGLVLIRKSGKLPRPTLSMDYTLEYGLASIEVHRDAISKGQKVLLVDDVLATGGTAKAAINLIQSLGGQIVRAQFLLELDYLHGRDLLDIPIQSVLHYR